MGLILVKEEGVTYITAGIKIHSAHIRKVLQHVGELQIIHSKGLMTRGKTGKLYRVGRRTYKASGPGEAPAKLSGKLYRGTTYKLSGSLNFVMDLGVTISGNQRVPIYLERGTKKMAARPFIQPSVDKYETLLSKKLGEAIK